MLRVRTIAPDQFCPSEFVDKGALVVWGQGGAEPLTLTEALVTARAEIGGFRAFIGLSVSDTPDPLYADHIAFQSYCGSGTNRYLSRVPGALDILPIPYSQLPAALAPVDVLLLHLPPAGPDGTFSLGLAEEYLSPLIDSARLVVAEVNDRLPEVTTSRRLTASEINIIVETSRDPLTMPAKAPGEIEQKIASHVADLIEDRSTLQLGLGQLPEAVLAALEGHRDLGIHSGTIGDGVARLTERGVITNAFKSRDTGISVGGVLLGSDKTYDFARDNADLRLASVEYTHNPEVLASLDRFVAINSAIEVDLTGQINAELANGHYLGAVGGAGEFLRGAHRSRGGVPIIALPSQVPRSGASRIVATLSGPVSTPRSEAGFVVTEHGVVDLRGRSLRDRRRLMLGIAPPEHREALSAAAARQE